MDLRVLARALDLFAVLEPTHLYVHFVQVFLVVAQDGPCTIDHIAQALSLSNSAVSRTVQALGEVNRKGEPGYLLVTVTRDPAEGRRFIVMLTTRGKAIQRQLAGL